MKTIFKVGMEVWDKTISPKSGKVIEVFTDYKFDFPIKVEFENNVKVQYTPEGCFVKNKGVVPTLSTSDYSVEKKGFEQKASLPTFKELFEKAREEDECYWLTSELAAPSAELGEATEAMLKLLFYREYYNEGWKADWSKENWKYSIVLKCVHPIIDFSICDSVGIPHVLSFKTRSVAKKFLEEQKELLIIARHLL
jgi:hypothetical protein